MASVDSIIEIKPSQELLEAIESMQGIESMLKQAIREVLLSEQFLMEFAKAFVNTPRPSTIQAWSPITGSESEAYCLQKMERERQAEQSKGFLNSDKIPEGYRKLKDSSIEPRQLGDLRWSVSQKRYVEITVEEIGYANLNNWAACRKVEPVVKQSLTTQPPDGWRWLEVGEVICKGDEGFENGRFYAIEPMKIGMTLQSHWMPTIRRNRFEVGEKVIDCRAGVVLTVQHFDKEHLIVFVDGVSKGIESKHFAPYIEEAK